LIEINKNITKAGVLDLGLKAKIFGVGREDLTYIFVADSMGLSSFKFSYVLYNERMGNDRSRSSKVVDFGTN